MATALQNNCRRCNGKPQQVHFSLIKDEIPININGHTYYIKPFCTAISASKQKIYFDKVIDQTTMLTCTNCFDITPASNTEHFCYVQDYYFPREYDSILIKNSPIHNICSMCYCHLSGGESEHVTKLLIKTRICDDCSSEMRTLLTCERKYIGSHCIIKTDLNIDPRKRYHIKKPTEADLFNIIDDMYSAIHFDEDPFYSKRMKKFELISWLLDSIIDFKESSERFRPVWITIRETYNIVCHLQPEENKLVTDLYNHIQRSMTTTIDGLNFFLHIKPLNKIIISYLDGRIIFCELLSAFIKKYSKP